MKSEFSKLKNKLLIQACLIVCTAFAVGALINYVLIDGILEAPFADAFVFIYEKIFNADWYVASSAYQRIFRNNKMELLLSGLFILTIAVFYYSLSSLTRYFKEVSHGVDRLVDESQDKISLSPEMSFMEMKLNTVNKTLQNRAKELKETEKRKNDLVMYLAHDIKTPLTSVLGYLNLLSENTNLPKDEQENYLNITLEKANRLELLINEFFEIARYNSGNIILKKSSVSLYHMLSQMKDEFYPQNVLMGKDIAIEVNKNITVYGDSDKLARVFLNILKNAVAYSEDGSTIEISAFVENDNVKITFKDYGSHIPESELEIIFDKFYRLDKARVTDTGGAGLGLAIAKEIVTLHNGKISAMSDNGSTTFTVSIPVAPDSQL